VISGVSRLGPRLFWTQILATVLAMLASGTSRWLLLLDDDAAAASVRLLWQGIGLGGFVALLRTAWSLRHHRFLLRTLALGSTAINAPDLGEFATEAWRTTFSWTSASLVGLFGTSLFARPGFLDPATALGVTLFGIVVVAASALPLYVWTRLAVMRAMENAPPEIARELVETEPPDPELGRRIRRRLIAALVAPVAFVTIGSTLVVTAHVRRVDGERREAIALAMSRAAFETVPGAIPSAGLDEAVAAAEQLGFSPSYAPEFQQYRRLRTQDGNIELIAPLDEGSVRVRVEPTTFRGIGPVAWVIAAVAAVFAAAVGSWLGSTLTRDLQASARGVRALDTRLILQGGARVVGPTRYQVVSDLGIAIEDLAGRFRLFAQAQERAITLREAATRMRGLFFASVSHDLKTPLNAILGFAAVIRQTEELSEEQEESLAVIERSGRELLALIEMILDAARVEARQLKLLCETVTVGDLMHDIIEKGRYLAGDNPLEVVGDIADGIGVLEVDRVRVASALGTFLGHAGRSTRGALIRLRIAPIGGDKIGFAIEMPQAPHGREVLLANRGSQPSIQVSTRASQPSLSEVTLPAVHRGLALGMGLARSVIELHGGTLTFQDRGPKGQRFIAVIPARRTARTDPSPTAEQLAGATFRRNPS
jgi:signal transduction histidine kinase